MSEEDSITSEDYFKQKEKIKSEMLEAQAQSATDEYVEKKEKKESKEPKEPKEPQIKNVNNKTITVKHKYVSPKQQRDNSKKFQQGIKNLINATMPLNKTSKQGISSSTFTRPSRRLNPLQSRRFSQSLHKSGLSNLSRGETRAYFAQLKQRKLQEQIQQSQQMSENTKMLLDRMARVQNLAKTQDAEMQRRLRERQALSDAGNLLKTPNIFQDDPDKLKSWLSDSDHLITSAPNVFKELPNNRIMRTNRPNIMQTKEVNNNLNFFSDGLNQKPQPKPSRLNFWRS